jgi:hypothetical protein
LKPAIVMLAVLTALTTGGTLTTARAESGFEAEPVLRAGDLVAPELLKGPRFTVDDRVPVKGFLARFTLRSDYGTYEVHGIHLLQVRVKEVYALGQLDDMSETKEFAEAAGKAIARPVVSTVNMLVHPVDTITGFPDGVGRLFDRIKLGGQKVVEAATAPGTSGTQKVADVSERVGSITVNAMGYEKERRDLAKGLGVDPYTTNEILAKKLDDMAWVAFSGRFGIQAAMSILVPYSTAMSAATITNSTIYDTPPGDLINGDRAIFAATGASDGQVQALIGNKQYSLSLLTTLAMAVQRLQGVPGIASVVGFAAIAQTQDETRLVVAALSMLARYHESVARIAEVTAPGPIVGRSVGGALVVPAPVDYVAWTQRADRFAQRDDLKAPDRTLWVSGRLSPDARKEAQARGWKLDESFSIAAER